MQEPSGYRSLYSNMTPDLHLDIELEKPKATRKDWHVMPKPFQLKRDHGQVQVQVQTVNCRICQATMDVSSHLDDHTVACPYCKEATAIKNAPVGYKYVTCTCNALLVCENKIQEAVCPRATCQKIIQLPSNQGTSYGVVCSQCQYFFLHCTESYPHATCPRCRKIQRPLPGQSNSNTKDKRHRKRATLSSTIFKCFIIGLLIAICAFVISLDFVYSLRVGFLAFLIVLLLYSLCKCLTKF